MIPLVLMLHADPLEPIEHFELIEHHKTPQKNVTLQFNLPD